MQKFCMSPSLDGTMPESVISQENNSLLTLYIEFQFFFFFLYFSWIYQVQLIKFNHKMHAQSVEGRCIFMKSENFVKYVYSSIRQLYCCDITDISTVPPERAAYNKLTRTLKNHIS